MICYVSAHFDFPVSIESYKLVSCEVQSFIFVVRVIETWFLSECSAKIPMSTHV